MGAGGQSCSPSSSVALVGCGVPAAGGHPLSACSGKCRFRGSCRLRKANFALERSTERCTVPFKAGTLRLCGVPSPAGCGTGGVVTRVARSHV